MIQFPARIARERDDSDPIDDAAGAFTLGARRGEPVSSTMSATISSLDSDSPTVRWRRAISSHS